MLCLFVGLLNWTLDNGHWLELLKWGKTSLFLCSGPLCEITWPEWIWDVSFVWQTTLLKCFPNWCCFGLSQEDSAVCCLFLFTFFRDAAETHLWCGKVIHHFRSGQCSDSDLRLWRQTSMKLNNIIQRHYLKIPLSIIDETDRCSICWVTSCLHKGLCM